MAIAAWKRFEKSDFVQRNKARLRQLAGTEPRLRPDCSVSTVNEGGWVYHADDLSRYSVIYCLGIGDNIEFDLALIKRCGAEVHGFDPTPNTYETLAAANLPEEFVFHAWAVAGSDGSLTLYPRVRRDGKVSTTMFTLVPDERAKDLGIEVPAYTLATIADKLGHAHIDLLKMDVEGAEYEIVDGLLESELRPRQLLIEYHHRHKGIGKARTEDSVKKLRAAGYEIFAVSDNVREVSFLYRGA